MLETLKCCIRNGMMEEQVDHLVGSEHSAPLNDHESTKFALLCPVSFTETMSIPPTLIKLQPQCNSMHNYCECNHVYNVVIKPKQINFERQGLLEAHLVSAVQGMQTLALLLNLSLCSITVHKEEKLGITQSLEVHGVKMSYIMILIAHLTCTGMHQSA